ncbi:MAG: hypothetical protein AUJ92_09280 [Armatimonadetes bacterium CG2_30_59_28]|nr:hypothetical protein [Armatimonadota bacterium]OIO94753.1 MAG: hypothetical protein AUJ92_09280 [Armatimonadetes bacterium CG2_30_59_28]PIU67398.1 MAG: hypothetical protein COS85_00805 [Armatimonadetes bacterium CG07_land_8_20_14_0_80_59_28]PIX38532.1 MAG: hypothetical protein COZ56_20245 [Armatimonadetes bacterium CG_4_8_14_3_um_filter_58_9]PJB63093.1 MAG: hypothetical protein CO095_17170 [Armatimonadetes bacterium CG_4_9_14_3_um_filter_58_7]
MLTRHRLLLYVGVAAAVSPSFAAHRTVWQEEAEKTITGDRLRFGAALVDDGQASGGKAVRIPYQKDARGWSIAFGAPKAEFRGTCLFTFYLRGENMPPVSDGVRVYLILHDKATGQWAHHKVWSVYGINLKQNAYTAITLPLEIPLLSDTYGPEVLFEWRAGTAGISPAMLLDRMEIATETFDTPVIREVWPTKVRYVPGETAEVQVTVANPTGADATAQVMARERWGVVKERQAFSQSVSLKPGESKQVSGKWKLGGEEYGREIVVDFLQDGKVVDSSSELLSVSKTPLWLSTGNGYDQGTDARDMHTVFYVQPATGQESWRSVRFFKEKSPGGDYFEFFSWAPGDISDIAPDEDPFPGGEGRLTYRSKQTLKMQIEMLKSVGAWPVSYVNGTCWAESGYKLFQRYPEWFLYDANGEVDHYDMQRRGIYRHKDDADFDPNTYPRIFFQATLNHSLPAVQEYIANQYVRCGREMGFKGVRMDVRYLEVHPGERGFDGKEIAPTHEEADRISAESVRRVKELVHKEIPDFTFGYNYASPEEVKEMPLTMKERCAGAGWMLDEVPCTYQEKTSPYHVWSVYLRRMVSWGDQVNKWGGVYNPFDFRRGGGKYVVDNIYSALFRLIAGGRFGCYYNSRLPFGNLGRFSTRYSEFFFGRNREWISAVKGEVDAQATAPLWWRDTVFWNLDAEGSRQLLLFLINPPAFPEVEENPESRINPPVRDIVVTCAKAEGKLPKAAYLLTAEPMEPTDQNEVAMVKLPLKDAKGGRVSVTVSSVLFCKLVVFQY